MAESTSRSTPPPPDEPLSVWLLRGVHWGVARLARGCLGGGACLVLGGLLFLIRPELGLVLLGLGVGLTLLCFAGVLVVLAVWLPVVFFCHTRYSLGAMVLAFLGIGLGFSLVVMDDPVAKLVGGLLVLGVTGSLIAEILGRYDPLQPTEVIPGDRGATADTRGSVG